MFLGEQLAPAEVPSGKPYGCSLTMQQWRQMQTPPASISLLASCMLDLVLNFQQSYIAQLAMEVELSEVRKVAVDVPFIRLKM